MIFVIDASVAVKWFVDEPGREKARLILRADFMRYAPDIVFSEVANALRKKVGLNEVSNLQAVCALDELPVYLPHICETTTLMHEAYKLSVDLNHPVADCLYLACAQHVGGQLVSSDERFIAKCSRKHAPFAVTLETWTPPDPGREATGLLNEKMTDDLSSLSGIYQQTKRHLGRHWFEQDVVIAAEHKLKGELLKLNSDQVSHLIAACWFGALDAWDESEENLRAAWHRHLGNAKANIGGVPGDHLIYIISKLQFLETGLQRLAHLNDPSDP